MCRKVLANSPKLSSGLPIKPRYVSALEGLLRAKIRKARLKLTLATLPNMHILSFSVEKGMAVFGAQALPHTLVAILVGCCVAWKRLLST